MTNRLSAGMAVPTLAELMEEIRFYKNTHVWVFDSSTWEPEALELHLQVTDRGWMLHTGPASYLPSNYGYWGHDYIYPTSSLEEIGVTAAHLLVQVEEAIVAFCCEV